MNTCERCEIQFPDRFCAITYLGVWDYNKLCPECARKEVNRIGEQPEDAPFRGELAKKVLDDFRIWKWRHESEDWR